MHSWQAFYSRIVRRQQNARRQENDGGVDERLIIITSIGTIVIIPRAKTIGISTMSMLFSFMMLRRIASAQGRRLPITGELAQLRTFSSNPKFDDLEPLQKKENILPVSVV